MTVHKLLGLLVWPAYIRKPPLVCACNCRRHDRLVSLARTITSMSAVSAADSRIQTETNEKEGKKIKQIKVILAAVIELLNTFFLFVLVWYLFIYFTAPSVGAFSSLSLSLALLILLYTTSRRLNSSRSSLHTLHVNISYVGIFYFVPLI